MKPIEAQKTITVYSCADCGKEHGDTARAEQCCACSACDGPTTAEDKRIARGGSPSHYYRTDLLCEWCRVRKDVKVKQDRLRTVDSNVREAERRLEGVKRELALTQNQLDALIAKRDALPPKPREKKTKAAASSETETTKG